MRRPFLQLKSSSLEYLKLPGGYVTFKNLLERPSFSSHQPDMSDRQQIWRTNTRRYLCNLISKEVLNITCHVKSRIILLDYGHRAVQTMTPKLKKYHEQAGHCIGYRSTE
ncbi:hypothetical protein TNCV_752511 [Trichonephila clavipes]|uniref:Uncharacterized protein n=1 Tax=Trichonephila clavipes TaxID=2585209 RepID=A0A8X7BHB3_TRICX|nr:hypothetical protein TNCV_752511 [Trichonephila clavipes]